jgi:hypothetical protein
MAKKRVSNADLNWMIFERLREEFGSQRPVSVAIVHAPKLGWRAILSRRGSNKDTARKLRSIENELRASFSLAGD